MIRRELKRMPVVLSTLVAAVLLVIAPLPVFACGEAPGCSAETTPATLPLIWWITDAFVVLVVLVILIGLARRRAQ